MINREPVVSDILQDSAEAAQQFITDPPISYIRAVKSRGWIGMLLAQGKTVVDNLTSTGSTSSVEMRLDEFIRGCRSG